MQTAASVRVFVSRPCDASDRSACAPGASLPPGATLIRAWGSEIRYVPVQARVPHDPARTSAPSNSEVDADVTQNEKPDARFPAHGARRYRFVKKPG